MFRSATLWLVLPALLLLSSCATTPPRHLEDGCAIFKEKDGWYEDANDSFKKWGVPVHVQLAIIYQESRFRSQAKAPRDTLLGFIPWGRKSSAYGYAQVKDETWDWYIKHSGNWGADRDDFEDVTDFIGWYGNLCHEKLGISKWDAYSLYLAYHEGLGGYTQRTYRSKPWLVEVARKVKRQAEMYGRQLAACKDELDSGWHLWPF
ncbi:MAG TPA: transglycosylase SLT domain-containing protein [Mariprofundaceae bacterium]|nr:transglycosylase SLT domain-containing protein [Mariprofundaceae bacterium]